MLFNAFTKNIHYLFDGLVLPLVTAKSALVGAPAVVLVAIFMQKYWYRR